MTRLRLLILGTILGVFMLLMVLCPARLQDGAFLIPLCGIAIVVTVAGIWEGSRMTTRDRREQRHAAR